jgi:hypothetical protein
MLATGHSSARVKVPPMARASHREVWFEVARATPMDPRFERDGPDVAAKLHEAPEVRLLVELEKAIRRDQASASDESLHVWISSSDALPHPAFIRGRWGPAP